MESNISLQPKISKVVKNNANEKKQDQKTEKAQLEGEKGEEKHVYFSTADRTSDLSIFPPTPDAKFIVVASDTSHRTHKELAIRSKTHRKQRKKKQTLHGNNR